MKWIKRILFGLLGLVLLIAGTLTLLFFMHEEGPAASFDPKCQPHDVACATWAEFRQGHPFPYQAIAAKQIAEDRLILVLSEPSPAVSKADLEELIRSVFGAAFKGIARHRWHIGVDGWLEDTIVVLDHKLRQSDRPADDGWLTGRVALLLQALHGTSYGGDIEQIKASSGIALGKMPRFHVTPQELAGWLEDPALTWVPVADTLAEPQTWRQLANGETVGAFVSSDRNLVMLTFPTELLTKAPQNVSHLNAVRVPFREFAIASETVFGATWSSGGQTAVLARIRTSPLWTVPPLRFETFQLLATRDTDELHQSYERNAAFAGKLSGDDALKDWAPIYLDPSLIDTELGALLNITDQMLKSWSSAGDTEYEFFTYPKPPAYPFHGKPLIQVVQEQTKSDSVLFNWNTKGAAVLVRGPEASVLAVTESTALPVTYGADGKPKEAGGADLLRYEQEGYDYFAGLGDPNLARVVQYTTMYQLFRAIAAERGTAAQTKTGQTTPRPGSVVLASASAHLIVKLRAGEISQPQQDVKWILDFLVRRSDLDDGTLAWLAADRNASRAQAVFETLREEKRNVEIAKIAYNARIGERRDSSLLWTQDPDRQLRQEKLSIEERDKIVDSKFRDLQEFGEALGRVSQGEDVDSVRREFLRVSAGDPSGSIRTPSSVLSWSKQHAFSSTGGHNLKANALQFERSPNVAAVELHENADGQLVLRYSPERAAAVEGKARELARAVEHAGERDVSALLRLIEQPLPRRERAEALALAGTRPPEIGAGNGFGVLGARTYAGKKPFVDDLRTMAANSNCCILVARDSEQTAYIAEANAKPPPIATAFEARDTASLLSHLAAISQRKKNQRMIIFLDAPQAHVEALVTSLKGEAESLSSLRRLAAAMNGEPGAAAHVVAQADLAGRMSWLRSIGNTMQAQGTKILQKLGLRHEASVWQAAKVGPMADESLQAILKASDWEVPRDGTPTAVQVSFDGGPDGPPQLAIVAGFSESAPSQSAHSVQRASEQTLELAGNDGASVAQYLMTVRGRLQSHPPAEMRRLLLVVDEQSAAAIFSRLTRPSLLPNES